MGGTGWKNISDHFFDSIETVFRVKNTKSVCSGSRSGIRNLFDPGSVMEKYGSAIQDPG
jgi:hypothetical protein